MHERQVLATPIPSPPAWTAVVIPLAILGIATAILATALPWLAPAAAIVGVAGGVALVVYAAGIAYDARREADPR